ncbi:hyalin-like [Ptychodera flava]|uniref:hyalin-like n=1 Tax=Ptychodera flava TaxID=63121 RepID=UPI00396AA230
MAPSGAIQLIFGITVLLSRPYGSGTTTTATIPSTSDYTTDYVVISSSTDGVLPGTTDTGTSSALPSEVSSAEPTDESTTIDESSTEEIPTEDNEDPNIICPEDIQNKTETAKPTAVVYWPELNATDNSGSVNVTCTHQQGNEFFIGSTNVYCNATDPSGNWNTCNFTITIRDEEKPNIICQDDIEHPTLVGKDFAIVNLSFPNATDNSGNVNVTCSHESGTEFTIGSTNISCNASDPYGNWDSCQFQVIVTDVENPSIICPDDIEEYTDPGEDTAVVTWSQPNATDNSGSVNVTSNYQQGSNFVIGSTVVYYNASDPYGNVDSCLFTVTVIDDEPPTILCPDNIDVDPEPGEATVVVHWTQPNATDNSGYVTVTSDYQSGTEFSIGSTSIHYNASDPSGNVDSCQFNVTVPDVVNPEIICPGDIEVVTDPGQATAVVTWTSPNATDNSGSVTYPVTINQELS